MCTGTARSGASHFVSVAPERVKLQRKEARDSPPMPLCSHQACQCQCAEALSLPSRAPPQRCVAAKASETGRQ
jgi:hypothetical protein